MKIRLDLESLTLGELEQFEDLTGMTVEALSDRAKRSSVKVIIALIYIVKRREDPEISIDDVRELKMAEIEFEGDLEDAAEEDPNSAAEEE